MIYNIFDVADKRSEPTTLRLIMNDRGAAPNDVSVVVVDYRGDVRSGGYLCTFREDGSLFLVADVGREFGFKLDSVRRIIAV